MKRFLVIFCMISCSMAQNSRIIFPDDPLYFKERAIPRKIHPVYTTQETKTFPRVRNVITNGITQFTLNVDNAIYNLTKNSMGGSEDMNIIFSPLSLAGNLALLLLASKGETSREIIKILGLESNTQNASQLKEVVLSFGQLIDMLGEDKNSIKTKYASGIFVQNGYPVTPAFKLFSQQIYKSEFKNVDFKNHGREAREIINEWVKNSTMSKIPEILNSDPDPQTEVILASALYFYGAWDQQFHSVISKRPFEVEFNKTLSVDMMINDGEFLYHEDKNLGVEILGLPYKNSEATMYVLLPSKHGAKALKEFKDSLNPEILENLISNMTQTECNVILPKMKLSSDYSMTDELKTLGLKVLFDPAKADLGIGFSRDNFNENPGLYVDDVYHKVTIDVNERGTEAAAVTVTLVNRFGGNPTFVADRPFLFFIRHDASKLILFWATINQPTPSY